MARPSQCGKSLARLSGDGGRSGLDAGSHIGKSFPRDEAAKTAPKSVGDAASTAAGELGDVGNEVRGMRAMPMKVPTRCRYPGCPQTARGRYCDAHRGTDRRYSDARRGTPAERGYDRLWRDVAAARRISDFGICQQCLRDGHHSYSDLVDHIVPIHVRPLLLATAASPAVEMSSAPACSKMSFARWVSSLSSE